jgi:hypothetical protein
VGVSGSSCPDYPSSEELSLVEVEAQIHQVLDLEVNLNPDPYLVHLRRGIVSVAFTILSFHSTHNLAQGLRGSRSEPWDADSPSNAYRQETRHASSEETWTREEKGRERMVRHRAGSKKAGDGGLP